jgi:hypothetical protein
MPPIVGMTAPFFVVILSRAVCRPSEERITSYGWETTSITSYDSGAIG